MYNPKPMHGEKAMKKNVFGEALDSLDRFIESLGHGDYGIGFLSNEEVVGLGDLPAIKNNFRKSVECLGRAIDIETPIYKLLDRDSDIGQGLKDIEGLLTKNGVPEEVKASIVIVLDIALAKYLQEIVLDKITFSHPQNLRHILSYFSERTPQFLLIIESLSRIIPEQDKFALEERGRAARTLINNYDIETILIYMFRNPNLSDEHKDLIIPWLIAFQKIYRRLQGKIYNRKQDKDKAAGEWFGKTIAELKKQNVVPIQDYEVPGFVRKFISYSLRGNDNKSLRVGKALVLVINNEDILRVLHKTVKEDPALSPQSDATNKMYHDIYSIMQEYRGICTDQKESELKIKGKFATISRERRQLEELSDALSDKKEKTPILGKLTQYKLSNETEANLKEGNLHNLFEIWPIPSASQEIFNSVCELKKLIPEEPDIQLNHLLYQEKIFEFLMRLERVGIKVIKDPRLTLITNAFQLNSFGFIKKGLYIGSTGCWQCPNQVPPSVICCTNPHSITNCLGHKIRHIFLRVFLGTGEFYESPFILDSTLRYGSVDEEGLLEGLLIRPGLFLIEIPKKIQEKWVKIQEDQLSVVLANRIITRIAMENLGGSVFGQA